MRWDQIKNITNGLELQHVAENDEIKIQHLLTDSRLLKSVSYTVFFAISGKQNGHHFIEELYEKGVRFFIVEEKINVDLLKKASVIQVAHTIDALQSIAKHRREMLSLTTIAITGSNGKTTVKEWLAAMLSTEKTIIKTPKSYNSQIGVALSVWNADANHQIGVFEAGISQVGEMRKLENILKPTIGIFTSIGPAHSTGFNSLHQKIEEKASLFIESSVIVCCRDHSDISRHLLQRYGDKVLDWSFEDEQARVLVSKQDQVFTLVSDQYKHAFYIPFTLPIWTENCLHAIVTAMHIGVSPENIQKAIHYLQPVKMRLSIKKGKAGCYLIDDTYNNDLNGLEVALDYLKLQKQRDKKTVILSEFIDSGLNQREVAERLRSMIVNNEVSRLLLIGEWDINHFEDWPLKPEYYLSKRELLAALPPFENEMVLIKGARKFRFEEIVNRLSEKSHRTQLEINFEALIHNLNTYRQYVKPGVKVLAMVKAFGYGGGGAEISNLLQFHNIDYLGVAYTDEAIQLRNNGVTRPIMVLNPDFDRSSEMSSLGIEPEVYSIRTLERILQEEHPPAIHLKIETGMNRLGLVRSEWKFVSDLLRNNPQVRVAGVFTHLSSADDKGADHFSSLQIDAFEEAYSQISKALGYRPIKHALNSVGIIRFPQYHFDMVRIGVGLYGYDASTQLPLRPVSRLVTYVSQVKDVAAGEFVGYSRAGKAEKNTRIAIIPIGYADGYDRRFGNGVGKVAWKGHLLPTIGNICMDMTMIDTIGHEIEEGDELEVFGIQQSVAMLAQQIGTIPYEILTSISERVVRVYLSE